jgi:hypothetical protein
MLSLECGTATGNPTGTCMDIRRVESKLCENYYYSSWHQCVKTLEVSWLVIVIVTFHIWAAPSMQLHTRKYLCRSQKIIGCMQQVYYAYFCVSGESDHHK